MGVGRKTNTREAAACQETTEGHLFSSEAPGEDGYKLPEYM
jgi:hypothetical protein